MPTKRVIVIFAAAVACAVLASVLVVRYVRQREEEAKRTRVEVQPVVVATSDIPIGTRLTEGHITVREWPKTGVPQAAVSTPEAVVGRLVRGGIARDEPILEHRLFPKDLSGAPGIMSVIVPSGKRAMAVGVNEVIGVSGFILPKDRVDVIATSSGQGTSKSTETIMQNIEVLAVGQRLEQEGKQNIVVPTVTMAVTPQQAERLARALQEGKIHIALRSIMDTQVADLPTITRPPAKRRERIAAQVVVAAPQAPAVAQPQAPKVLVVDVIRGDKRTSETHALE
jgi:pilus assembly protein CpaB